MKAAAGDDLQLWKDGNLQCMGVFELKTPIDFVFGFAHNKCTDFPAEPYQRASRQRTGKEGYGTMIDETQSSQAISRAVEAKREYMRKALREDNLFHYESLTRDFHIDDAQYESELLPFWKQYGMAPEKYWFEMAGSRDHAVNPLFVPSDFYFCDLIPYLNNMQFRHGTQDKCYYDLLFPDIHRPRSICRCMSGLHYDGSMNRISRDRAVDLILRESGGLVIKPSIYTCGGEDVKALAPAALTRKQVEKTLDDAGANFIVQEKVNEHPVYRKIAEGGPTTVRALSMLTEEGTYIPYMLLRVSPASDQIVHYGRQGYYAAIGDDNRPARRVLRDYLKDNGTFILPPRWEDMPALLREAEASLPGMDDIREQVKRMHPRLPHFRWIGWDFMVDEAGKAVFIECNFAPGYYESQTTCCTPIFGDMTEQVIDDFFRGRSLEKNHMQGILIL